MDATAMYTNIHLGHALPILSEFFLNNKQGKNIINRLGVSANAIVHTLEIVMNNNIFAFSDTFWQQIATTAMGKPPAPTWATLYFCLWEMKIIPEFNELSFYKQCIHDIFVLCTPNPLHNNALCFQEFKDKMQAFGLDHKFFTAADQTLKPLQWTFSGLASTTVSLDLNLLINNGHISMSIYEKT